MSKIYISRTPKYICELKLCPDCFSIDCWPCCLEDRVRLKAQTLLIITDNKLASNPPPSSQPASWIFWRRWSDFSMHMTNNSRRSGGATWIGPGGIGCPPEDFQGIRHTNYWILAVYSWGEFCALPIDRSGCWSIELWAPMLIMIMYPWHSPTNLALFSPSFFEDTHIGRLQALSSALN